MRNWINLVERETNATIIAHHGGENHLPHDRMFFTTDKDFASEYGKVRQYRIKLGQCFDSLDPDAVESILPVEDTYSDTMIDNLSDYMDRSSDTWEMIEGEIGQLKAMGYDSAIIYEGGIKNYLVFYASHIELID